MLVSVTATAALMAGSNTTRFFFFNSVSLPVWHIAAVIITTPFNGLFSRTTWVSRYQKGKTSLDLNEARGMGFLGWQWHQLDHVQTIRTTSRQITPPTPHHSIFTVRMLFPTPNKQ